METGIKPIVLEEIRMLAQKHKINKVILFGSRARGDYWRASDIDLAVQGGDIVNFALDVEENTSTLLQYDVDTFLFLIVIVFFLFVCSLLSVVL